MKNQSGKRGPQRGKAHQRVPLLPGSRQAMGQVIFILCTLAHDSCTVHVAEVTHSEHSHIPHTVHQETMLALIVQSLTRIQTFSPSDVSGFVQHIHTFLLDSTCDLGRDPVSSCPLHPTPFNAA